MKTYFLPIFLLLLHGSGLLAQAPQVQITQLDRATGDTTVVTLQYSLSDPNNDPCEVWLRYSTDGGRSFRPVAGSTGDVGFPVHPGNRSIQFSTNQLQQVGALPVQLRVVASDRQAVDVAQLVAQVDSNRLRQKVQQYAIPRHYISQMSNLTAVRDSLHAELQSFGLPVLRHEFMFNNTLCANVLARQSGHRNDSSIWIVDAHFDGVATSPGADDNASGVAGMLEIARILSQYEFEESLHYIGFDVEELGLVGSNRYVFNAIDPGDSIRGVFNFEMIGFYSTAANSQQLPTGFNQLLPALYATIQADSFRGNFLANVGNVNSLPLTALFDSAAARYVPSLKVYSLNLPGNGTIAPDFRRSDHAMFWDRGYQALMLTDGANFRNNRYHTPADTPATLHYSFMADVVKATLAAAATAAKPMSAGKADIVYGFALAVADHPEHSACDLRVQPNPNSGRFSLVIDGCLHPYGPASLRIFSLDGKVQHEQTLPRASEHQIQLDLRLPKGSYLVVTDDGHESFTTKLIVQ
jgi:hypothetical protein